MKNAKINDYNAVCALLEELERCYTNINYEDKVRIKEAIAWLDYLPAPEPLDPYTCELCVGDVVAVNLNYDTLSEGVVLEIDTNHNEPLKYRVFDFWEDEPINCSRNQLTLTQRNGATIKEVGNG